MELLNTSANGEQHGEHRHRPYWKHIHHDWKFWIALVFALLAIGVYVGSFDLSMRPRGHAWQQHPSRNVNPGLKQNDKAP